MAGRSADSRGSGTALDLYVFEEDHSGRVGTGEEISCAAFDARLGDEEGIGRQREGERDVSRAVSGKDWSAGTRPGGRALHSCGRGRPEAAGRAASRVRA